MGSRYRMHEISAPSVVVGIVTRNRAAVVPKAITSALMQHGTSIHVAVVDDGSSDDTSLLQEQYPEVKWKRWEVSQGYMAARNAMMQSAHETYFVSLDDDAWFQGNDEISIAIEHLEKNKGVAAVAFDILSQDRPKPVPRTIARPSAMFIGCGHLLRLSAARAVGFYEQPPGFYGGEEKDLCLRLMDAGHQIDLLPGVHVWHDKSEIARDMRDQHRSGVCNDLTMTLRRTPLMMLPVALIVKTMRHFWFSLRHGLLGPFFQGVRLFAISIGSIWRSRRAVHASTLRLFMRLSRSPPAIPRTAE